MKAGYQIQAMRITVTIDDDVYQAAKAQAETSGRHLGEVLSQMARDGMNASANTSTLNGLPIFDVPVDAESIPSSRARDLLSEGA